MLNVKDRWRQDKKREGLVTAALVTLSWDLKSAMQSNKIITQICLDKLHENHILNTLINNSAENNFLSQKLVMKKEISTKDAKVGAHTLENHSFMIYEWVVCEVHVTDSWEIKHDS